MKMQLKEVVCTNMEDWRKEMGNIHQATRMSDNSYVQNLVQPMPRRLQEVIERERGSPRIDIFLQIPQIKIFIEFI